MLRNLVTRARKLDSIRHNLLKAWRRLDSLEGRIILQPVYLVSLPSDLVRRLAGLPYLPAGLSLLRT